MTDFRVMTSGAFTAAHLALIPQLERLAKARVVTASTSVGTGEMSIPNRLKRGEVVDSGLSRGGGGDQEERPRDAVMNP